MFQENISFEQTKEIIRDFNARLNGVIDFEQNFQEKNNKNSNKPYRTRLKSKI